MDSAPSMRPVYTLGDVALGRLGYSTPNNSLAYGAEVEPYSRPTSEVPPASASYRFRGYETSVQRRPLSWVHFALFLTLFFAMVVFYPGGLRLVVTLYYGVSRVVRKAKGYSGSPSYREYSVV